MSSTEVNSDSCDFNNRETEQRIAAWIEDAVFVENQHQSQCNKFRSTITEATAQRIEAMEKRLFWETTRTQHVVFGTVDALGDSMLSLSDWKKGMETGGITFGNRLKNI